MSTPPPMAIAWFRQKLLSWFKSNGRHFSWRDTSATIYVKILSEVLLQRTQAEVVARSLPNFIARFPSWGELAKAPREELEQYIKPLGLWQRRAASLERLAKEMARREGQFPRTRNEIEKLPI